MIHGHRLRLDLQPSRLLCWLLAGVHGLAVYAVSISSLSVELMFALIFALFTSLLFHLARYAVLGDPRSVRTVHFDRGNWFLDLNDSTSVPVELENPVFACSFLIVLNFSGSVKVYQMGVPHRDRFAVAILPDNVNANQMRHARIFIGLRMFQPKLGGTSIVSDASTRSSG